MTAVCEVCQGLGFLLGQTYGAVDLPDGFTAVQRCDSCGRYDGDGDAAHGASRATMRARRWFPLETPEGQLGDWALGPAAHLCAEPTSYQCPICGTCRPDGSLPCLVCPS